MQQENFESKLEMQGESRETLAHVYQVIIVEFYLRKHQELIGFSGLRAERHSQELGFIFSVL